MTSLSISDISVNDYVKHIKKEISGKVTKVCKKRFAINGERCVYNPLYFKKQSLEPFLTVVKDYTHSQRSVSVIVLPYAYNKGRLAVSVHPNEGQDEYDSVRWLLLRPNSKWFNVSYVPPPEGYPKLSSFGVFNEKGFRYSFTGPRQDIIGESWDFDFEEYDPYNIVRTFYKKLWPNMSEKHSMMITQLWEKEFSR
jgi:hypothetical protein